MPSKVPYIGVTDFTSYEQVLDAVACIPSNVNRRLHVGLMMSYKTFHGIPTETGWEHIWLRHEKLRAVFGSHPNVFNVLHWADYGSPALTTAKDLISACYEAGQNLHGLQLDMIWPNIEVVKAFKEACPDLELILQISKKAIEIMESRGGSLQKEIEVYIPYVDYFLIDWGMGKGTLLELAPLLDYLEQVAQVVPQDKLSVAGGLGPYTYHILDPIFLLYPHISCDAQGQNRSSGTSTDPIEMKRVCRYIEGVSSLLG